MIIAGDLKVIEVELGAILLTVRAQSWQPCCFTMASSSITDGSFCDSLVFAELGKGVPVFPDDGTRSRQFTNGQIFKNLLSSLKIFASSSIGADGTVA